MKSAGRIFLAIASGGLAGGLLDQASAFASFVPRGATVMGILQYVASGLIGPAALKGGIAAAALGLAVQCGLTTIMAALFVLAALKFEVLLRRPWIAGIVYGVLTCVCMNFLIVPLSNAPGWKPPTDWLLVGALMNQTAYVGLPIAFFARHFLGARSSS